MYHLSPKICTDEQVIYLELTCDWALELLAMACNRSFIVPIVFFIYRPLVWDTGLYMFNMDRR